MAPQTVFEHPLNERVRTFLRLEHLFEKVDYFMLQYDSWATRVAVEALLDVTAVTARSDLKTDIAKELERNLTALNRVARQPGVDQVALERVSRDLERALDGIAALTSPIGQTAREDDFLKSVGQRSSIPGGACSFDLPLYHHWLVQSPERRQSRLDYWLQDLRPADTAIRLMLSLARSSATPREVTAAGGFFQEALDLQAPAQMVRVALPGGGGLYPEISGHKNRFSIRFMNLESRGKPTQTPEHIAFRLTCCIF
ncbi:cell division protein ZapD [uncultured Thiodictyon sp.]|uniref:cell division protein ZapD n=1 Tax=uncultured Thiodictyon sp. TaxID=1846217 RepID=UPI0025D36823|nr:cell division protein ZapD [uncultured Thiodictyon sp.]